MCLFFWFHCFLESRAEMCQMFLMFFGKFKTLENISEISWPLKEILHELDPKLTDYELDCIIEEVDGDCSGTVDFDEFMLMMTG